MAYDEGLAYRIEEYLRDVPDVEQKKMFGGLAFMVNEYMCVGVIEDKLMARVGPENYSKWLKRKHAKEMTFTGKPLKGMIYVEPEGVSEDENLRDWIAICREFVESLPPKVKKAKKR